jgi:hypothetical protein
MRVRFIAVALFLLAMMVGSAASAQETPAPFCGTLPQADCDLLVQSSQMTFNSAAMDFSMDVAIDGVPDIGTLAFGLNGSGAFNSQVDSSALNLTTMASSAEGLTELVDLLREIDAELNLNITLPPELAGQVGGIESIALDMAFVDGVGYINMDNFSQFDPSFSGWQGTDLVGLLNELITTQADVIEEALATTATTNPIGTDLNQVEGAAEFVQVTRTDDGDVATFTTTADLTMLLENEAFREALIEATLQQQQQQGQDVSEADIRQFLESVKSGTVLATQSVRISTGEPISQAADFQVTLDGSAMDASGDVDLGFQFEVSFSELNAVATIAAPKDAVVVPYRTLLQMFAGFGAS